jgi:hypothetical protein
MAPKLKVFRTHLGFYDMVVAAPSQKAALVAWGASPHVFAQGFASVTTDPELVEAALKKPGIVLRRQFGSKSKFQEGAGTLTVPRASVTKAAARREREHRAAATGRAKRQATQEQARQKATAVRDARQSERSAKQRQREAAEAKRTERGAAKAQVKQAKARHDLQRKLQSVMRERKDRIREIERREQALAKERREIEQSFETRVVAIQRELRTGSKDD